MNLKEDPVILFDGVCNLCNSAINFIIRHDKQARFHFAPLQGVTAKQVHPYDPESSHAPDSIILIENGKYFHRSTAVLRIARKLSGWPSLLYGFIIVPPFIRDWVYNLVAKKRYRWFGQRDQCMIPTPDLMNRFLK